MDNLDDSEKNVKVSDSAYSTSCSNSQSRRSHSSKSTHSGSNSSGSSGYGGKPSNSASSYNLNDPQKRDKESKKKKAPQSETIKDVQKESQDVLSESQPAAKAPKEGDEAGKMLPPSLEQEVNGPESMDISTSDHTSCKDETMACVPVNNVSVTVVSHRPTNAVNCEGFSCVISMENGVVMYTTPSLTAYLGYLKEMWIGRSFIDFIHPLDRKIFASQITSGLAFPKSVTASLMKGMSQLSSNSTMVCRIRRYRGLVIGFSVKESDISYMPFFLKLSFKSIADEEGKSIYLVLQATPIYSAYKAPNEIFTKIVPFVIRHGSNGYMEYLDAESVPYLGYLPQDIIDTDALQLYHPDDLVYLRQVYDTIVKIGVVARGKTYRMMAQNGDYVKLETEWSSFTNPWSKRLEFVIGKHYIIEGPTNPNIFQSPDPCKAPKLSDDAKEEAKLLRESIIRLMNEVVTKPIETAKQQMNKRCQDLANFMESLVEEQLKTEEEFRLEITDADQSCYERDSVMLGGISPHHEYNDSKSSTETPLSYTQLNYNETLQRYFESHQIHPYEQYTAPLGNAIELIESLPSTSKCQTQTSHTSGFSAELNTSCDSSVLTAGGNNSIAEYLHVRLTESMLTKHNSEMEKELMKVHRETRTSSKSERQKVSNETRQKKKEHLARCNASFQPTTVPVPVANTQQQAQGVKRPIKTTENEGGAYKVPRNNKPKQQVTCTSTAPLTFTTTTTVANSPWPNEAANNMNTFIVGMPHQMSIMSPVPTMPSMFPMYYTPGASSSAVNPEDNNKTDVASHNIPPPYTNTQMKYMMPVYGSPFIYSPISAQMTYSLQASMPETMYPLGLATSTYEETCKASIPLKFSKNHQWAEKMRAKSQPNSFKSDCEGAESSSSTKAQNRSKETPPANDSAPDTKTENTLKNGEETVDKTDEGSSYSSFYSSFFKTESRSAEESADSKKNNSKDNPMYWEKSESDEKQNSASYENFVKPVGKPKPVQRKQILPPWLEQVNVTPELVYKYQVVTKTAKETLAGDMAKLLEIEQSSLVNDQLGQLYLDLQLQGVTQKLTLEEGITSSSSSGEETSNASKLQVLSKKREYSKLGMIYEEDAPLPPAPEDKFATPTPVATKE